jgi:hypothetical protein
MLTFAIVDAIITIESEREVTIMNGGLNEEQQKRLNDWYDRFTKEWGFFPDWGTFCEMVEKIKNGD